MFITTSFHPTLEQIEEAKQLAQELSASYVKRERSSLTDLYDATGEEETIIVSKKGWRYENRQGNQFFFHPHLSLLRIKQMRKGMVDPMVRVAGLKPGDHVLDCTLGMGADAIVASHTVGATGRVVALESQPVIAQLVKQGLQTYRNTRPDLDQAMRQIEVIQTDYRDYLRKARDSEFDVIIFDPMFRQTIHLSRVMQTLKPLANPNPLDSETVNEALRVTKKAILLKERVSSGEFERLGFHVAKKSSHFAWGVIRK